MNNNANFEFSKKQNTLLGIAPLIFIILTWKMIPLHVAWKIIIYLFLGLGSGIFLTVNSFVDYLSYFKAISSAKTAFTIAMIIFVILPLVMSIFHDIHQKQYLSSYPTDNLISVKITYDIERIGSSGSIGHDWIYKHYLNDTSFENGEIVNIDGKTDFTIKSRFIESDDSISDIGETISKQYRYIKDDNYKKVLTISQKVHVTETGGRRYAGSTADFNATYKLKRVIPESMNYWDMVLYTSNDIEYFFCLILIISQILCIAFVIFILINGRIKEKNKSI